MEFFPRPIFPLLCCLLLAASPLHADILKGRVVDAETKEAIPQAEVKLKQSFEWEGHTATMVSQHMSDSLGCFELRLAGRGTLTVSMLGYYPRTKTVLGFSDSNKDTIDVGDIDLKPSETLMKMLEVKGRARRFTVRGDTIVFNPEAFHLQDGARLDELIRQLPGVEVAEDGSMTWNGKPIRITMDGESLFGGSDLIQQLPAEAVENIKAYNKASKYSERTGKDDGGEDMVLDLTIKPGFLDRWYGDLKGTYETRKHYDADLYMHRLSKKTPVMVSADANNTNTRRHRAMNRSWGSWGGGYGQEQGAAAGMQHNWHKKEGTQEMRSNYSISGGLSHYDTWSTTRTETENYAEADAVRRTMGEDYSRSHNVNPYLSADLSWDLDSLNTLRFNIGADHKRTRSNGHDDVVQDNLLSQHTRSNGEGRQTTFNAEGSWLHFMGKDASLRATFDLNYDDQLDDQWTERDIINLQDAAASSALRQYAHRPTTSFSATANASYRQWLAKRWMAEVAYVFNFEQNRSRQTFETDGVADLSNSYRDRNHRMRHTVSLRSTIDLSALKLMPSLSARWVDEWQTYQRGQLDTTATRSRLLVEPSLRVTWKLARTMGLELKYGHSTTQPSLMSTLAYRDQTNPLYITEGNPNLKDTHTNNVSLNINSILGKQQLTLSATVSYKRSDRATRTALTYQPATGVYTSRQENVRGGEGWEFRLNYDQGFGDVVRLQNDLRLSTEQQYGFLMQMLSATAAAGSTAMPMGVPVLNRQTQLCPSEKITLSADWQWLKLSAFGSISANRQRYSHSAEQNTTLWNNRFGIEGEWRHGPFTITTKLTEYVNSGYTVASMNRKQLLWDASASWKLLKNKARLTLSLDDILNAEDNRYISQSAFQQTVTVYDNRHHYIGLSFTYHLDAKAKEE